MVKSIHVCEKPDHCSKCKFAFYENDSPLRYCFLVDDENNDFSDLKYEELYEKTPDWCPLKETPEKLGDYAYCPYCGQKLKFKEPQKDSKMIKFSKKEGD